MESKAKLLGHAIHPMLIVFPLGLLGTSVIFDGIALFTSNFYWSSLAYWMIVAGIISGLIAAIFGLIDWLAIRGGTRAKSIGMWHALFNTLVLALFGVNLILRGDPQIDPGFTPRVLSVTALGISLVSAWLGGELVERLGVGVDKGANLNASSSLSGLPAETPETGKQREAHQA